MCNNKIFCQTSSEITRVIVMYAVKYSEDQLQYTTKIKKIIFFKKLKI